MLFSRKLIIYNVFVEYNLEKTIEQLRQRVKELEEENNNIKKLYTSCVSIVQYL